MTKLGLFVGEYRHNLTEKYRLSLPKRIRVEIEGFEVVLAKGFEACIVGYDRKKWEETAKVPLGIPEFEEKGRVLRRRLFASVIVADIDAQGRIVLPETYLDWANLRHRIGEEVVIIGAGDHFEIWQKENWEEYSKKLFVTG